MSVNEIEDIRQRFRKRFGGEAEVVVRSPGRVNLIGDHTDYNEGFVMPAAIRQGLWIAARSSRDATVAAYSETLQQGGRWLLEEGPDSRRGWGNYVLGVASVLKRAGFRIAGAEILIDGDLPIGSGLSSSAAIEVGVAMALLGLAGLDETVDQPELARLCQKAEHEYAGVPCGIMDQFCCLMGRKNHAVLLDCRTMEHRMVPFPDDWTIAILDTQISRQLVAGEYAARQADCRRALQQASQVLGRPLSSLRDLDRQALEALRGRIDQTALKRAAHVVTENDRVLAAAEAFEKADARALGEIMAASHASLRDDYQVSCRELDALVEIAGRTPGVIGARMTGAGFGGCAVAVAWKDAAEKLRQAVEQEYNTRADKPARILKTRPADGARVWK